MRNLLILILASAMLIGLPSATSASSGGKDRNKLIGQRETEREREIRRSRGVPIMFHRRVMVRRRVPFFAIRRRGVVTNFGRRRSALAHRQNAERRALHERFKGERQTDKIRGLDRRDLAMRENEERRVLHQRHKMERRAIRP